MARLGDVIEQIRGVSYKPSDLKDTLNDNSVILLRANNIQDGKIVLDDVLYVSKSKVNASQYLRRGDILVCTSSGSKELVGKAASVDEDLPAVFGAFCKVVRPKIECCKYVGHFFQSPYYRNYISAASAGANINNLRNEHIADLHIPLPPLDKQRKIAAVLDKVSDLIAKRRQQLDKLDLLIKARFLEMFGDPENNSRNWRVLPMSKICSVGSSKRIYQSEQSSSGIPFWRVSDLTNLINTGTVTPDLYIPEERYEALQSQGQVPAPDDILITSRGTLGQCYIVKANDRFYFQDGMISWLSGYMDGVTPLYISYLFTMPGFRKQIDSMQAGSTVAYLSIAMIKKLKVMLPDMESQQQFASFVEQTEKTKTAISRSLEKLETLKKVLMQEYFG